MRKWGENYWDTYSPVVNSIYVRAIFTLRILRELHTKPVYFILAYQDDVKPETLTEMTIGFGGERYHPRKWAIRLYKKLYVLKYACLAWFEKLKEGLEAIGFFQSQVDPCDWYIEEMVLLSNV